MRTKICLSCGTRQDETDSGYCCSCGADMSMLDKEENFIVDKDGVLLAYHGNREDIVIPDSVKSISNSCFDSCTFLKSVVIGESVERIDACAFLNCSELRRISFGSQLSFIGHSSFFGTKLEEVIIPSSVTIIGEYSFYGIRELKKIIIHEGCETVCDEAFLLSEEDHSCDRSIYLPSTLSKLGLRVFLNACGTNDVYTPHSEFIEDYFKYDDYPIVMHFIPHPDLYESELMAIVSKNKAWDQKMISMTDQKIEAIKNEIKPLEARINYLKNEIAKNQHDAATLTGFFQSGKRKKAEENVRFYTRWLAECKSELAEKKDKLSLLYDERSNHEKDDSYYREQADFQLKWAKIRKCGNILNGGYGVIVDDISALQNKSSNTSHNPADDWIVIPQIDTTGM